LPSWPELPPEHTSQSSVKANPKHSPLQSWSAFSPLHTPQSSTVSLQRLRQSPRLIGKSFALESTNAPVPKPKHNSLLLELLNVRVVNKPLLQQE
jgi:hypothetical protein